MTAHNADAACSGHVQKSIVLWPQGHGGLTVNVGSTLGARNTVCRMSNHYWIGKHKSEVCQCDVDPHRLTIITCNLTIVSTAMADTIPSPCLSDRDTHTHTHTHTDTHTHTHKYTHTHTHTGTGTAKKEQHSMIAVMLCHCKALLSAELSYSTIISMADL